MKESLTWEKIGGAIVFRFHGSIESDFTSILRQDIFRVLQEQRSDVAVFHLGDATYIDSMGIGMFVHLHVQHHERVKFLFCDLKGSVFKSIRLREAYFFL